uniref:Cardiolipin synthase N-terminal domain-containing protein n=1 Tax=Lotus japonicus TaxID=34305 RepID=I3ST56_LOTJA|nr:unknown [Lotus japonicus]
MLLAKPNLISCNFPTLNSRTSLHPHNPKLTRVSLSPPIPSPSPSRCCFKVPLHAKTNSNAPFPASRKMGLLHVCHTSKKETDIETTQGRDWTTSILLFFLWAALMYYVFFLSPDQTPTRDLYFLKKLLNLKGDDGFRMNEVLVSMWYIMGLRPLAYSMLLLPTGRSSESKIPVWPFLILSCFGGVYALLPYFVLWKPPAPPVEETQLKTWPLNFLESKVTAVISLAAGIGLITYAGLSGDDVWKEFYQYFRESKFIHIMTIDFTLLSTLAPFWVYNDMTTRKWFDKGSRLLPVSLIPFLGPGLYLLLRPSLSTMAISQTPVEPE